METEIYLDTARLGRMRPSAQAACQDFARLCGEEGGSSNVETFLRNGHEAWPRSLQDRYPGLSAWTGANGFKQAFRDLVRLPAETNVWFAQRSKPLMKLAARALCRRCERILHTDLEWPPYLGILRAEARCLGREVIEAPTRTAIFAGGVSTEELVHQLAKLYRQSRAQGLFISDVSFEGVRQPVRQLLKILTSGDRPKFVAIDAAQGLGHVPPDYDSADLILAGCHKWLEAGLPLCAALASRKRSQSFLIALAAEMIADNALDDPILNFVKRLESGRDEGAESGVAETINLISLFTASASVAQQLEHISPGEQSGKFVYGTNLGVELNLRLAESDRLAALAASVGWIPLHPHSEQRSGILLLKPKANPKFDYFQNPFYLRNGFQKHGVALTVLPRNVLRVSIQTAPSSSKVLERLSDAMAANA